MLLPQTLRLPAPAERLARAMRVAARSAVRALVRWADWCARCHARAEQRRALAELDDQRLRDVGLTRAEARAECAKPWWRD